MSSNSVLCIKISREKMRIEKYSCKNQIFQINTLRFKISKQFGKYHNQTQKTRKNCLVCSTSLHSRWHLIFPDDGSYYFFSTWNICCEVIASDALFCKKLINRFLKCQFVILLVLPNWLFRDKVKQHAFHQEKIGMRI